VYKQAKAVINVFVHGDSNETFVIGVVVPDPDALKAFAAENNIKGPPAEVVKDPRVAAWLLAQMDAAGVSEKLRGFEFVKRIHVSAEDFSVENGLLTPTFKLKRNVAAKHFGEHIAKLYKLGEPKTNAARGRWHAQ
jgi:long-chain acyl-CoA synthetase